MRVFANKSLYTGATKSHRVCDLRYSYTAVGIQSKYLLRTRGRTILFLTLIDWE